MMNNNFYGGSICMIPEVENNKYVPALEEEDYDPMFDEGYPYRIPKVYLEGWIDPYESLDSGEDSVVVVRNKHIVKYTKSGYKEYLAKTETGETVWVDGRMEYCDYNVEGHCFADSRTVREYTVEEYDIETSKKRKYKVVFDEESEMNSLDYYLLSHSVDAKTLGNHFEIKDGVLSKCFSKDAELVIPEGVTEISEESFRLCGHFDSIVIPSTVTKIPCGFCHTKHIEVSKDNPKYYIQDGCLIDKEEKELVWAYSGTTIPDDGSVIKIGRQAFADRGGLTSIVIPNAITEIGTDAFKFCVFLEEIILPETFVNDSKRIFGKTLVRDGDKWTFGSSMFEGFTF